MSCSVSALGAEVKADLDADEFLHQFKIHIPDEPDDDNLNKYEPKAKWLSILLKFCKAFFCSLTPIYLTLLLLLLWLFMVLQGTNSEYGPALDIVGIAVGISFALFIFWLFLRFFLVHLLVQYCFEESVIVGAALDLFDPYLMNLFWSLSVRIFWFFKFSPVTETVVDSVGSSTEMIIGYHFELLDNGMLTIRSYDLLIGMFVAQILWTLRDLSLNIVMFKFMLEFTMNISSTVAQYLSTYTLLRRLNSKWIRLTTRARIGSSVNNQAPTRGNTEFLRGVRASARVSEAQHIDSPRGSTFNPPTQTHRFATNILADAIDLKRDRRFQVEHDGQELPSVLTKSFVERARKEPLLNLLGVNYIRQYPTALFVGGHRVELSSKSKALEYSNKLFLELLQFQKSLPFPEMDPSQRVSVNIPTRTDEATIFTECKVPHTVGAPFAFPQRLSTDRDESPASVAHATSHIDLNNQQTVASVAAAITAAANSDVKNAELSAAPPDCECITREVLELFFSTEQLDQFMGIADPGGYGKVSIQAFFRVVQLVYTTRKQLMRILDAQEGIQFVFRRMVSLLITFVFLLAFLILIGMNVNTIIISGAAVFSSIAVSLSNLYSSFMQSVTLICFLNPYNIGDRVRIDDGDVIVVRKITTFFTIFDDLHAKPLSYSHSQLISMKIMNESRSKNAGLELNIDVLDTTSATKLQVLRRLTEAFCYSRPLEWKQGTFLFFFTQIQPGSSIRVSIWITHVEGWHNWRVVYGSRSSLYLYILKICDTLGITFKSPVSRWEAHEKPGKAEAKGGGKTHSEQNGEVRQRLPWSGSRD